MAQASGSPPGSLVICTAMRAGKISASPSSSANSLRPPRTPPSPGYGWRDWRGARELRGGFQRRVVEIVQDQHAFFGVGRKEQLADLGSVLRLHRQVGRHSLLRFGRRACRARGCGRGRYFLGKGYRVVWMRGPEVELDHRLQRRAGIDRQPRPHGGAGGIIDLFDQARGQFDELPLFVRAVRGLDIEVGQHAQQGRADVDALAARDISARRNRETWELRSSRYTRTAGKMLRPAKPMRRTLRAG